MSEKIVGKKIQNESTFKIQEIVEAQKSSEKLKNSIHIFKFFRKMQFS